MSCSRFVIGITGGVSCGKKKLAENLLKMENLQNQSINIDICRDFRGKNCDFKNLNKKSKKSSFATWNNKEEDTYDARAASDAFQSYALRMQQKRHRHLEQKDLSRILVETKDYCRAQGTTVALQEVPLPRVRIPG
ncbi:unnamed protein product [Caenorhabditis angaria]|uniref:Uncharacterized protein n=1 Tax=Caenorhabditis angaria TaxID=860376 RepID=A0A9P1N6Z2_9PELO|nr:unnamed protein product [Caenorhabditis angaria]